jgi:hypothetical protein
MSIFDSETFNNVLAPSVAAPQADEIGVGPDATSLEVMQAIYRNPAQPIARRMRAAQSALPYEHPKLAIVATGNNFAASMKEISRKMRPGSNVIDHRPSQIEPPRPIPELDENGKPPQASPFRRRDLGK